MKTLKEPIPGEILLLDWLQPFGITQYRLAKDIGVPKTRIFDIVHGKRAITADTAARFAAYFGNTPQFWLNLQNNYDLRIMPKPVLNSTLELTGAPAIS